MCENVGSYTRCLCDAFVDKMYAVVCVTLCVEVHKVLLLHIVACSSSAPSSELDYNLRRPALL